MGREQPERVSREAASKAGKRLQASEGLDEEALAIAHTWRVQHLEPTARCFEALSSCSHQFEGAVCLVSTQTDEIDSSEAPEGRQ